MLTCLDRFGMECDGCNAVVISPELEDQFDSLATLENLANALGWTFTGTGPDRRIVCPCCRETIRRLIPEQKMRNCTLTVQKGLFSQPH